MCFNLLLAISKSLGNFLSHFAGQVKTVETRPGSRLPSLRRSPFVKRVRREGWRFGAKLVRGACHLDVLPVFHHFTLCARRILVNKKVAFLASNCVTHDVHVFEQHFGQCLFFVGEVVSQRHLSFIPKSSHVVFAVRYMVSERQKAMERGLDSPICEPWQPSQLGPVDFGSCLLLRV